MKNFTLILSCLLTGHLLWGQIEKGAISFSGNLGASYSWAESERFQGSSWDLNTSIAFMVSDHWLVGGTIGTFGNLMTSDNSLIQPEVRYYFNPLAEKNKYYTGFVPSFNFGDFEESFYNFIFGFNRFLNKNIALDANAIYTAIGDNQPDFISINLGLRPFLNRADRNDWKTAISDFNRGDILINTDIASVAIIGLGSGFDEFLQLNLNPSAGIFINEQFMLGAQLGAGLVRNLGATNGLQTSTLTLAPFARYYLGKEQKHWRWFGQAGFTIAGTQARIEGNFNSNSSAFFVNSRWGANWFLTSNLAFELGIDLNYNFGTNS